MRAAKRHRVCVTPWAKGPPVLTFTTAFYRKGQFHQQGGKASSDEPCPTKLRRWRGSEWRRPFVYLQLKRFLKLFHLRFDSWWFHMLVPKTSFLQPLSADFEFAAAVMRLKQLCSNTYNFSDLSPCCSTAILPIVVTELTEYKCRSVCVCVCVCVCGGGSVMCLFPFVSSRVIHYRRTVDIFQPDVAGLWRVNHVQCVPDRRISK